jgi:hypothetical protein
MIARISSRFAELETNPRYQHGLPAAITLGVSIRDHNPYLKNNIKTILEERVPGTTQDGP